MRHVFIVMRKFSNDNKPFEPVAVFHKEDNLEDYLKSIKGEWLGGYVLKLPINPPFNITKELCIPIEFNSKGKSYYINHYEHWISNKYIGEPMYLRDGLYNVYLQKQVHECIREDFIKEYLRKIGKLE